MQQDAVNAKQEFRDYGESAGLGSLIWGAQSQFLVRYFHYVVAFLTSAILFLIIVPYNWLLAFTIVAGYLIYVAVRKVSTRRPAMERKFYRKEVQLLRAEMGWVAITLLLFIIPGSAYSALWLLYIPILMLTSRHCPTEFLVILYVQSGLALITARAQVLPWVTVLSSPYLWADVVAMGLLAYVIHYLVRNIQARNWTIAGDHRKCKSTDRCCQSKTRLAQDSGSIFSGNSRLKRADSSPGYPCHPSAKLLAAHDSQPRGKLAPSYPGCRRIDVDKDTLNQPPQLWLCCPWRKCPPNQPQNPDDQQQR